MNIEKLFSTKERVNILNEIIYLEKEFGVNEIARKVRLSKGLISKYFNILLKENLIRKKKNKFVVKINSEVKSIRIMLNIQKIEIKIFKKYKFIKSVGLYGSCIKGVNTELSDIDLWIKIENTKEEELAELTSELRKKIRNIKIIVLDDKKIEKLKRQDILFYHSLYFGSIILYGRENGI